jgi:hypothetical protein
MPTAKSLVENLLDKKATSSFAREDLMCRSLHVYSESFNREKAQRWFEDIPPYIKFRGNFTFYVEGMPDKLHFAPPTIADFISIVQSLGHDLKIDLTEEDELDRLENKRLRKLIQ